MHNNHDSDLHGSPRPSRGNAAIDSKTDVGISYLAIENILRNDYNRIKFGLRYAREFSGRAGNRNHDVCSRSVRPRGVAYAIREPLRNSIDMQVRLVNPNS